MVFLGHVVTLFRHQNWKGTCPVAGPCHFFWQGPLPWEGEAGVSLTGLSSLLWAGGKSAEGLRLADQSFLHSAHVHWVLRLPAPVLRVLTVRLGLRTQFEAGRGGSCL